MRWAALHQGDPSRWLVAAGVVAMLVALVVVVACRPATSPEGDAGVSQPTKSTVRTDAAPVATGLAVAGPVALPGPAAATLGGRGLQAAQRCASHRWRGSPASVMAAISWRNHRAMAKATELRWLSPGRDRRVGAAVAGSPYDRHDSLSR
jgi:hypothetical protein